MKKSKRTQAQVRKQARAQKRRATIKVGSNVVWCCHNPVKKISFPVEGKVTKIYKSIIAGAIRARVAKMVVTPNKKYGSFTPRKSTTIAFKNITKVL